MLLGRLAPYLRIPLLLGYLGTPERVGALADERLQAWQDSGVSLELGPSPHNCPLHVARGSNLKRNFENPSNGMDSVKVPEQHVTLDPMKVR